MKKYTCGLCKRNNKSFTSSRKGLRKHLREEHLIKSNLTNFGDSKKEKNKQKWWIDEEF